MIDWHRLFGLMLTDFFTDSPFVVELEKDLSLKQQRLDVVVVRKQSGTFADRLPDGLDNFSDHNLLSFKSHQEAFDAWSVKELIGHYVNYRKQVSLEAQLLPEESFRLYAVCARYPAQLAAQIELEKVQEGVLQCHWGTDVVRFLVLRDLPREIHNAPLHLFSAVPEHIEYAQGSYRKRSPNTSSLIDQLLLRYRQEGIAMPYTMEDFRREVRQQTLRELTAEERKKFFQELTAEERTEVVQALPAEDRLKGLSKAEIERYLAKMKEKPS